MQISEFLKNNLRDYQSSNMLIGFTHSWESQDEQIVDEQILQDKCLGIPVEIKVSLRVLIFKKGNKELFRHTAIVTERVRVAHKLANHGFGGHSYIDEAKCMETAVLHMAIKHNMFVCTKVCSWPFAKVLVGKVLPAHVKNYSKVN